MNGTRRDAKPGAFRARGAALVLAALLLAAARAEAQTAAPPPAPVEAIKETALDLSAEIDALEQQLAVPADDRLTIYLGAPGRRTTLLAVDLAIDGEAPIHRTFTATDVRALRSGGLCRLANQRLATGSHRIRADVMFRDTDALSPNGSATLHLEGGVDKLPHAAGVYELSFVDGGLVSARALTLIPRIAAAATDTGHDRRSLFGRVGRAESGPEYQRGGSDDPRVREARFLAESDRSLSAAMRLAQVAQSTPLAPAFYPAYADVLARYGLTARAQTAVQRGIAADADPASLAQARLRLAELLYRHGRYAEAGQELAPLKKTIGDDSYNAWQGLQSRVLLAQRRFEEAGALLRTTENDADFDSYLRYYNLGVALIRGGQGGQGTTLLDRVGNARSGDPLLLRLRDQANLSLAYYFLRARQGATAIPILGRIPAEGPFANRALLGLGWAWLSTTLGPQAQTQIGNEIFVGPLSAAPVAQPLNDNLFKRYGVKRFAEAKLDPDEKVRLKRALAAWSELIDRDPEDPAVQEGLIAIALALERVGAHDDSVQYFKRAMATLQTTAGRLDDALGYAHGDLWMDALLKRDAGGEAGSSWRLRDLPSPDIAIYIADQLAGEPFQTTLRDYRDLRLLRTQLQGADSRLAALQQRGPAVAYQTVALTGTNAPGADALAGLRARITDSAPKLAATEAAQKQALQTLLVDDLEAQRRGNAKLIANLQLALARAYDGDPNQKP